MIDRRAARVLVVTPQREVLLLRGGDPQRPDAGTWWFTPGGGAEPDETPEQAARRELAEETGLDRADLGPIVWQRVAEFEFDGRHYRQTEDFFLLRVEKFEVDNTRWTDIELATVTEHRWWPIEDLRTTAETVYPENLPGLLDRLLQTG